MEDFRKMVQIALFDTDNARRAAGEKQVSEFCSNEPLKFLQFAVAELANEGGSEGLRQGCGTLFVRALRMPGKKGSVVWLELDENDKNQIKTALMVTLVTPVLIARRAAASGIAAICSLELPLKQWPQIIPNLINNLQNQDPEIKKAALMTLGFVCEELKNTGNPNCLEQDQIECILMGILIGMSETETNPEIREISVKACHDSLPFMEQLLGRKDIRNYLMKCLLFSLKVESKNVKIKTAQCLIDFSKLHYPKLEECLLMFVDSLVPVMLHNDEEVAIPAIEVFNTIAIEDRDRDSTRQFSNVQQINASLNYMKLIYQKIIPALLQNLLRDPNQAEDGELSLHDTATKCLCSIIEVIGDDCLELLKDFISRTINAEYWVQRQASMIAFASIIEGPSKSNVETMVMQALENIIQLLNDKHERVRVAAANTLNRISEVYPMNILNHPSFSLVCKALSDSVLTKPKISRNICWVFNFLADAIPNIENSNHPVFQNADEIMTNLVKNTQRKDLSQTDNNVVDITFMALMNVLHYVNRPDLSVKYLCLFIDQFKNSYTESITQQHRASLQSGLLSAIHTALLRVPSLDETLGFRVYTLVIDDFKMKKEVTSDGIYAMSALSSAWRKGFLDRLDEYWEFLLYALGKHEDVELFKAAIGSLADISRSCEDAFVKFLPQVVPSLLKCLHSPDVNRDVKLHIFLCLGDIALGCKMAIIPYLDEIKKIYDLAFTAAVEISKDNESLDYAEQLKEKLVESYICFVHCFGGTENANLLLDHFPNLFSFLMKVSSNDLNPTVEFLRNVLALVGDIANFYKQSVKHLVKTQFTQDLINTLQRFAHIKENEMIIKYAVHVITAL